MLLLRRWSVETNAIASGVHWDRYTWLTMLGERIVFQVVGSALYWRSCLRKTFVVSFGRSVRSATPRHYV